MLGWVPNAGGRAPEMFSCVVHTPSRVGAQWAGARPPDQGPRLGTYTRTHAHTHRSQQLVRPVTRAFCPRGCHGAEEAPPHMS